MSKIKTSGVILAGGQSRRFGQDKAFFAIGGKPMVQIVADVLKTIFNEVFVAGGEPSDFEKIGLRCIPDPVKGKGALGGLYNGLLHTEAEAVFFCGCDMPLIKKSVINILIDNTGDEDILLPVIKDIRQPLHAVYKKSILPVVEKLVHEKDKFLPDLFDKVSVIQLDETNFSKTTDSHLSFVGMNDLKTVNRYRKYLNKQL